MLPAHITGRSFRFEKALSELILETFRSENSQSDLLKNLPERKMSLPQAVASYLSAWEGHTALAPESYARVMNLLDMASIEEINTEMNSLTQQQLWNGPLTDLFHDELLDRIDTETTFAISTAWRNLQDWIQNPFVVARIGFEDSYFLTDEKGNLIRSDDPTISSYTLTNASFQEPVTKRIIHMLIDGPVDVTVNVTPSGLQISSLASRTGEKVDFLPISDRSYTVSAQIRETPDFNVVKRMYLSLKTGEPTIIDVYADRLIDQLIDYREARNIVDDNGDTFEGDLFLTGTGVDEG